jgi:hypothetical protein
MTPTADTTDPTITRLRSVHASGRVAHTLLGVALDLIAPYASDYLSADDYDWLAELVDGPVHAATSAALATLTTELDAALGALPPADVARLKAVERWRV